MINSTIGFQEAEKSKSFQSTIKFAYLLALSIIASLCVLSYIGLYKVTETQKTTAAVVNTSGRQRMLSQRITILAHDFIQSHDFIQKKHDKERIRKELLENIALMETSHRWLINGNEKLNLPGDPSPAVREIYFGDELNLDHKLRIFAQAARSLAGVTDEGLIHANTFMSTIESMHDELLDLFNMAAGQYQKESEERISLLKIMMSITLGAILLAIFASGRFIFRPMARRMEANVRALIEGETRYRALFENANDAIYLINFETMKIVDCNKKAAEMDGYSVDELKNKDMRSLVPEEDLALAGSTIERIERNGYATGLSGFHHVRKDGSIVPIEVNTKLVELGSGKHLISVARDISNRLKWEKSLIESKNLLERTFSSLEEAVFLVDTKTRNIISCNTAVERIFGYSEEEVIGQNTEFLHVNKEMYEKFGQKIVKTLDGGKSLQIEYQMRKKNGEIFHTDHTVTEILDENGQRTGVVSVVRDITERKRAEEDLIRLATAVEQAAETVVITDIDGNIQYVNPAFEIITGYSRMEVIGKNPRVLKSGQQSESFYEDLWGAITSGNVWVGHFVNKKKGGEFYEEDATITPIHDIAGNIVGYVAVKRDVTNEVRLERQIRQAQKMEAIGTMAGGIAHDFNNILSAIIGYTELAMEELPEGGEEFGNLEEVLKAGRRAKELVRQILTFSRQTEQTREQLDMGMIVKEALKMLRATTPATIEMRQNIASGDLYTYADPGQMSQVVMNLCVNASQSMRESGGVMEISLKTVVVDEKMAELSPALRPDDYIKFTVADTGTGMDKKTIERIFDPFFTTKSVGEGIGMGLATVHGIVASHGGAILVDSKVGKGSTFQVYLPKVKAATRTELPEQVTITGGNERILFVDDEAPLANMGKKMLERYGYEVVAVTSGEEALDIFRKNPDMFDLIITDQTMPKVTGETLAREALKIRPDTRIIISTGFSHTLTPEKARELGVKEYIMKPFIARDLASAVRSALGKNHGYRA